MDREVLSPKEDRMARAARRLLPHEHQELNDYIRMISRYPVMDHAEFDRRIRQFLPVQQELEHLEKELEPFRDSMDGPPEALVRQHAATLSKRNALREPLFRGNMRLTVSVVGFYVGRGLSVMDLIQEGQLGIVRALERFEPERGLRFSTYAMHWVRHKMRFALRQCNSFRVFALPHHVQDQFGILVRLVDGFRTKHGRRPNEEELLALAQNSPLGEAKRITRKTVHRFLEEPGFGTGASLDAHVDASDSDSSTLLDFMHDPKSKPDQLAFAREALAELRKELAYIMGDLPGNDPRHARILRARFGCGEYRHQEALTLQETGEEHGLTRERIRQLESVALRRRGVDKEEVEAILDSIEELERQLAADAA
ncbi:sigma-70 family RNA polymerase sigma factor [Candidatus Uhrbacteria bacterium]|nr:sigma-70 family RNA polymerase sigma factor [Candidatus Uhrbacteria bacterium]